MAEPASFTSKRNAFNDVLGQDVGEGSYEQIVRPKIKAIITTLKQSNHYDSIDYYNDMSPDALHAVLRWLIHHEPRLDEGKIWTSGKEKAGAWQIMTKGKVWSDVRDQPPPPGGAAVALPPTTAPPPPPSTPKLARRPSADPIIMRSPGAPATAARQQPDAPATAARRQPDAPATAARRRSKSAMPPPAKPAGKRAVRVDQPTPPRPPPSKKGKEDAPDTAATNGRRCLRCRGGRESADDSKGAAHARGATASNGAGSTDYRTSEQARTTDTSTQSDARSWKGRHQQGPVREAATRRHSRRDGENQPVFSASHGASLAER